MGSAITLRAILLAALVLPLGACSSIEEDICDARCECEYCSGWEYDNCVNDYEYRADDADYWGCEDFYDDWMACQEATWYCRDGHFHTNCGAEKDRLDACSPYYH